MKLLFLSLLIVTPLIMSVKPTPSADAAIKPYSCRNGFFPSAKEFYLAKVSRKTHFYDDGKNCPYAPICQTKSYLIKDDILLLNQKTKQWVCGWYSGPKHESVGWLRAEDITITPIPIVKLDQWVGKWKTYPELAGEINISKNQFPSLTIKGEAFWYGLEVSPGHRVIHTGELFHKELIPFGNRLTLKSGNESYDCQAKFTLIPPFLIVSDNKKCGGANVTFDGVYKRVNLD